MSLASNTRWVALSQVSRIASQLISITVLTRLLSPDVYGLMAMALVVTNLAYLFKDMGTGSAVIQSKEMNQNIIDTVYWMNIGIGLLIFVLIYTTSGMISDFYIEPKLQHILHWLAFIFPITSLSITHQALLERNSQFSKVAMAEVFGVVSGLVVAIVSAYRGFGVMSLVFQMVVNTAVTTSVILLVSRTKVTLNFVKADLIRILKFSSNLSVFNILVYISRNADSIVIGKMLGSVVLGVYSMAYRLMLFPVQNMTWVASRALYPVISRHQENLGEVCKYYLKTLGTVSFITAPVMAGLFALRDPFVMIVFGTKWAQVPLMLAWLAPVGFMQSLASTAGTVFMALGYAKALVKIGFVITLAHLVAFIIGGHYSIEMVAQLYLVANIINVGLMFFFCARILQRPVSILIYTIAWSVVNSITMAVVSYVVYRGLITYVQLPTVLSFICSILAAVLVYTLMSVFNNKEQLKITLSFFKK